MEPAAFSRAPASEALDVVADLLVRLGLVTRRQAEAAGHPSEERLVAMGALSAEEAADARAMATALAASPDLESYPIAAEPAASIVPAFALRHQLVPLGMVGRRLVVAVPAGAGAAAGETAVLDRVATMTGHPTVALALPAEPVGRACRALFDPHALRGAMARAMEREHGNAGAIQTEERPAADAPIVDLVNDMLARAVEAGASDVHLDPFEGECVVRLRVDGILRDVLRLPRAIAPAVVTRLKLMADLNILERRHPQDGRLTLMHASTPIDVRIATVPTRWGELVVMRLLRPLQLQEGLSDLGFLPADLARFRRLIASPNGIVLVTGPTGSGKSTTLYGALSSLDRVKRHVLTIEDPIEYGIERAMQIQVNPAIGLTFAKALRSALRLDPNVILVGEIRDPETLEIAMHAAMTGHLVLSTLHANDAVTTFPRMVELGATGRQIASSLVGVVAQRLVRRACAACAPTPGGTPDCRVCAGTGYKGRVGVYEVLAMDDDLSQAVTDAASIPALRARAREAGMTSMWEDGLAKVRAGFTTLEELERVVKEA